MKFSFSEDKDEWLFLNRGVSFNDAIAAIALNGVLADFEHPDQDAYPGQRIMVLKIHDYPHCLPYSVDGETIQLKTIFPSRKFKYLMEDDKNG